MGAATKPPPTAMAGPDDTGATETQWSIVARQFRKNRAAVWGLRGAVLLLLLAIYSPVIASGLPFLWKTLAGNVFFTVLFFAVFQLVERYQPHTQSTESR